MSLWSIARSPLMFGGDLPSNDEATLSLISNDEVLAVDQHATESHQLFSRDNNIAWVSTPADSKGRYLAVFNAGDRENAAIHIDWKELDLPDTCSVRDLWAKKDLGSSQSGYTFHIGPHASGLYKIR